MLSTSCMISRSLQQPEYSDADFDESNKIKDDFLRILDEESLPLDFHQDSFVEMLELLLIQREDYIVHCPIFLPKNNWYDERSGEYFEELTSTCKHSNEVSFKIDIASLIEEIENNSMMQNSDSSGPNFTNFIQKTVIKLINCGCGQVTCVRRDENKGITMGIRLKIMFFP